MINKLFFTINKSTPRQFATVPDGKPFIIKIDKFPTLDELETPGVNGNNYLIRFEDGNGNEFSIFSIPTGEEADATKQLLEADGEMI